MFSNLVLKGFKNYKISGNFLGNSDSFSPEVSSGILFFFFFFWNLILYTHSKRFLRSNKFGENVSQCMPRGCYSIFSPKNA